MRKKNREKREHERLVSHCLIRFNSLDSKVDAGDTTLVNAKNLSETGLLFLSPKAVPLDGTIQMEINLPVPGRKIEVLAKVIHCDKVKGLESAYHIGVLFVELSKDDRNAIKEFVAQVS